MDTLQEKLQEWLVPIATKLSEAKILRAISGGFSMLLPIIMIGAFASLFSGLNIEAYQNFVASAGLKTIFAYITTYTTNMIAVYAAFSIARSFAQQLGADDQANLIGLTTLMIFFMMIPTGVGQGDTAVAAAISTTYFGSAGLFTAIILGLVVPAIYVQFIRHNVTIKMPEGVPPMVEQGFAALIPALCLAVLFVVVRQLCLLTPFGTLNDLIYGCLSCSPEPEPADLRHPCLHLQSPLVLRHPRRHGHDAVFEPSLYAAGPREPRCLCSRCHGHAEYPDQYLVVHLCAARRLWRHHRPCPLHASLR